MKTSPKPKYVTEATFKKEINRLDETMNRLALSSVQHGVDIQEIKATMMTKKDGEKIITYMQELATEFREERNSARIHLNQLMDFRPQIDNHEKRLTALESQARVNE